MRYDRARQNLDRHPNYMLAAYMASGTYRLCRIWLVQADDGGAFMSGSCPGTGDSRSTLRRR
jgi:hypothetical protein